VLNGILRGTGIRLAALACIGLFAAGAALSMEHASTPHAHAGIAAQQPAGATTDGVFGWD